MELNRLDITHEWRDETLCSNGQPKEIHASGRLIVGDVVEKMNALLENYEGKVKLIYMDPPFMTGEKFTMRVRVGAAEWRTGNGTLRLPTYHDKANRVEYLNLMRQVLTVAHKLLSEDGMLFVHIDYRVHPHMRLLLDEIFGEDNFLNEIIWVYQTGGRTKKYFSRKHDVILFYRKTEHYDFNVEDVMTIPVTPRTNHMRKHVDPDGRTYRSIRSGGRVYTYYDDDPVAPSDVWDDLSHLQQRDPERTGYDTQKPLALLNRIVRCASRPGDLVLDPFAGSSTTLEAALKNGRNFIGIDACPLVVNIARRRLFGANLEIVAPSSEGTPVCRISVAPGVGFYLVMLEEFALEEDLVKREFSAFDAVDNWSVGYLKEDGYHCLADSVRRNRHPELKTTLEAPIYDGDLAVCVSDVLGRSFYYRIIQTEFMLNSH